MGLGNVNFLKPVALTAIAGGYAATIFCMRRASSEETVLKAAVAYKTLAFVCTTGTISSCTAWFSSSSKDVKSYLENISKHFFCIATAMVATTTVRVVSVVGKDLAFMVTSSICGEVRRVFS